MSLTSGKTYTRRDWRNRFDDSRWEDNWSDWDGLVYDPLPLPEGINPLLEALRHHEKLGNDPEETVLTPLEEWLYWMEFEEQEVTDDPYAIEHATRVFHLLAVYRGVR